MTGFRFPGILLLAAILTACSKPSSTGGLHFDSLQIETAAEPGTRSVWVEFPFQNQALSPVKILALNSSCTCLQASADKELYQPGDWGVIQAEFALEGRTGVLEKQLTVKTDQPETSSALLSVKVTVPLIIELDPDGLTWAIGSPPIEKTVQFRVVREKPIHITKVESKHEHFAVDWKEIERGRHYEVLVRPQNTDGVRIAAIRIETDCEIDSQKKKLVFVHVDQADALAPEP